MTFFPIMMAPTTALARVSRAGRWVCPQVATQKHADVLDPWLLSNTEAERIDVGWVAQGAHI